jgi:putative heme-binding domain-containing protein
LDTLQQLVAHPDEPIRVEAIRALARHNDDRRIAMLREIARNPEHSPTLRAEAVLGLATRAEQLVDDLIEWSLNQQPAIRDEALRALVGVPVNEAQRAKLAQLADSKSPLQEAVLRILSPAANTRPPAADVDAWSKLVADTGDAAAGERIFLGVKVGRCAACHVVEGLGESVGPDLSQMSRRLVSAGTDGRRWLLETVLQPSRDMAPQFTPWQIVTTDGKQHLGLPRRKGGNSEAYLGIDGKEFSLKVTDIESRHEAMVSIMPADLLQQLTRQELADLFAFVSAKR